MSTPVPADRGVRAPSGGEPERARTGEGVGRSPEADWEEQIVRLLRRPENLRSVYQPIVDLRTGECVGYEALTRVAEWPARSPQPWFKAAARTGMSAQFEAAALLSALRGRAGLPEQRFLTVNVGPTALGHPSVTDVLLDQGDLRGLVAELTDLAPVVGQGRHVEVLNGLRQRGLFVAADVADTGVAELERVVAVRPDLVKLDRDLVKNIATDAVRLRVISLVVSMSDDLGSAVLAEGVESPDDARALQACGVRMGQGWLFGRARPGFLPPSAEVSAWLHASWEEDVARQRVARLTVPLPARPATGDVPAQFSATPDAAGPHLTGELPAPAGDASVQASATGVGGEPTSGVEGDDTARDRDGEVDNESHPDGWQVELDGGGRARAFWPAGSGAPVPASEVLRVRASSDLQSAARRVALAGEARRRHGFVAVMDDAGRFVGVLDADTLLAEALGDGPAAGAPPLGTPQRRSARGPAARHG